MEHKGTMGIKKKVMLVREGIKASRSDVVCIEETKWNYSDLSYLMPVLPSFFENNCLVKDAINHDCFLKFPRSMNREESVNG
jgi:hypothetical protein